MSALSIKPYDPSHPLAFLHVPKCSGASLIQSLCNALNPETVISGFDGVLFGNFAGYDSVSTENRRTLFLHGDEFPKIAALIAGHFAASTLMSRYDGAQYIIVVREPISRLLSLWLYWRSIADADLVGWGSWGDVVRLAREPLATFLTHPAAACQTDNIVTRMLLWPHDRIPNGGFIALGDDDSLAVATTSVLRRFSYLAVTEDPDFRPALSRWLGATVADVQVNVTSNIPDHLRDDLHRHLTPAVFDRLRHLTRLDRTVWTAIAHLSSPHLDADSLREQALVRTVARHALIMH